MTYRQRVKQIYPEAILTKSHEVVVWVDVVYDGKGTGYVEYIKLTDGLGSSTKSLYHAWKEAWKNTQKQMIKKLESA